MPLPLYRPAHWLSLFLLNGSLWLTLVPVESLSAQPLHRIEIAAGSFSNATHDALAAPVQYRGRGTPLSVAYRYTGTHRRHSAQVRFSKTGFGGHKLERDPVQVNLGHAEYLLVEWSYAYGRRIGRGDASPFAFHVFAGPAWSNTVHVREYFFMPENSEISWDVFSSIGVEVSGVYRMRRGAGELSVFTPVISYMNRPPYALEGDDVFAALFRRSRFIKLGRFSSFNRLIAAVSSIGYTHRFTPALSAGIGYHVKLYRYREPRPTAVVLQEMRLGIGINW